MLKEVLVPAVYELWPMLFIFTVIISAVRIAYLISKKRKFVLYKECLSLLFIVYILILFYIVTFQDSGFGTSNFTPFKEIFRYQIGSSLFLKNIVGNLLLFIPFGILVAYYLKNYKLLPVLILSFISSSAIEITQYKIGRVFDIDDIILNITGGVIGFMIFIAFDAISKRLPKIMRQEWFVNLIFICLLVFLVLSFINFDFRSLGDIFD